MELQLLDGGNLDEQHQWGSAAEAMSLPFRKELEKYKNINEDEILSKLSEDELKQLEHVLDDLDPEVGDGGQGIIIQKVPIINATFCSILYLFSVIVEAVNPRV